jgi:hypothetical protein
MTIGWHDTVKEHTPLVYGRVDYPRVSLLDAYRAK